MHNYTNQRQTKGTVLLVCFRCVNTLLFAPKHGNTNQKNRPFGLWFVSDALIHCCLRRNMPKACPCVMTQFAPSM